MILLIAMYMTTLNDEDHFLTYPLISELILFPINLTSHNILEIGVGHGELTKEIINKQPKSVVGFEIVKGRCKISHPLFSLIEDDITKVDLEPYADYALICNPLYSLLPWIGENFIDKYKIKHSIIMVSPKYVGLFPQHTPIITIDGSAFTPPSKGKHIVIVHGFEDV